jgi:hypothetical protein
VLAVGGLALACGPESANGSDDAGTDTGQGAGGAATGGGAGGGAGGAGGAAGVDGGGTASDASDAGTAADTGGADTGAADAPADAPGDAIMDTGGPEVPMFVQVWDFDNPSLGVDGWTYAPFGFSNTTMVTYDPTVGWPSPGSLLVHVPFTAAGNEQGPININYTADLTGRMLTATVRLDSGGPARANLGFSSTGNYVLVMSPAVPLVAGQWTTLTLDPANPPAGSFIDQSHVVDGGVVPPNPADTRVIVVNISDGVGGGPYTPAVVHVDEVGYY